MYKNRLQRQRLTVRGSGWRHRDVRVLAMFNPCVRTLASYGSPMYVLNCGEYSSGSMLAAQPPVHCHGAVLRGAR